MSGFQNIINKLLFILFDFLDKKVKKLFIKKILDKKCYNFQK